MPSLSAAKNVQLLKIQNTMTLKPKEFGLRLSFLFVLTFLVSSVGSFATRTSCASNPGGRMLWQSRRVSIISLLARPPSKIPGSELFPEKGRPYTPSGLSEQEYKRIKMQEEEKVKAMDYGAWGPRFKRSDRPDGDWMVMPSLWTNGFNARPLSSKMAQNSEGPSGDHAFLRLASFLKHKLPGVILGYIFIDILTTGFAMLKTANLTMSKALWTILKLALFKRKSFYVSSFFMAQLIKVAFASAISPRMDDFLEYMNRRRLWTKRRTMLTSVGLSIVLLVLWGGMLSVVSMSSH